MSQAIVKVGVVATCFIGCVLQLPGAAEQTGVRVLLDFPKTLRPDGWKVEGYAFGASAANPEVRQAASKPTFSTSTTTVLSILLLITVPVLIFFILSMIYLMPSSLSLITVFIRAIFLFTRGNSR